MRRGGDRTLLVLALLIGWSGPTLYAADAEPAHDLISVDFHDADVRQVLRVIDLKMQDATFVIDEDVQGTVTTMFRNASAKEALDRVMKASGLTYRAEQRGQIVHVMTRSSSTTKER